MTASVDAPATGEEDVKRRVRFDAEADLRLLQAVVKREPFAADHGTKLKSWDDVADEVYASAAKLRDVPSSRRAVTDRFHHLLLRYEQGTLKLKRWTDTQGGDEKAALVVALFKQITARLAEIRNKKAKRTSSGGRSSLSSLAEAIPESRKRSASSVEDSNDEDVNATGAAADAAEGSTEDAEAPGNGGSFLASAPGEEKANAKPKAARVAREHATASQRKLVQSLLDETFQQELLALKREKLELKRQKLALLREQHEERMALERQRLVAPPSSPSAAASARVEL